VNAVVGLVQAADKSTSVVSRCPKRGSVGKRQTDLLRLRAFGVDARVLCGGQRSAVGRVRIAGALLDGGSLY